MAHEGLARRILLYFHKLGRNWKGLLLLSLVCWTIVLYVHQLLNLSSTNLRPSLRANSHNPSKYYATSATAKQFTIVVNAFRRDDRVQESIDHYQRCPRARWIYVCWNDIARRIPTSLRAHHQVVVAPDRGIDQFNSTDTRKGLPVDDINNISYISPSETASRVVFFVDAVNVISNRFRPRTFLTAAVLSVDDDVLYDCDTLAAAHDLWLQLHQKHQHQEQELADLNTTAIPSTLLNETIPLFGVGFAPRQIDLEKYLPIEKYRARIDLFQPHDDPAWGQRRIRYYAPKYSFETGYYNTLFVTKGAFLPRQVYDYYWDATASSSGVNTGKHVVSTAARYQAIRELVDKHTTGEDVLMSAVCWDHGVKLVALHSRPQLLQIYHNLRAGMKKQKHVSLAYRSIHWRPLIISRIVELFLNTSSSQQIPAASLSARASAAVPVHSNNQILAQSLDQHAGNASTSNAPRWSNAMEMVLDPHYFAPSSDSWYVRGFWRSSYQRVHLSGEDRLAVWRRRCLFTYEYVAKQVRELRHYWLQ